MKQTEISAHINTMLVALRRHIPNLKREDIAWDYNSLDVYPKPKITSSLIYHKCNPITSLPHYEEEISNIQKTEKQRLESRRYQKVT